jgi:soluble cytochrome b562
MSDYQGYVGQLQKQYLSAIQELGEVQAHLFEAVRTVASTTEDHVPSATETVEKSFGFATDIVAAQRDIALRLVDAGRVTPTKAARKQTV